MLTEKTLSLNNYQIVCRQTELPYCHWVTPKNLGRLDFGKLHVGLIT
jgi:hypothetical protein